MQLIMDSPKSSTILTRTRSKTTSTSESTAGNSDAEMAPNLNGSKDGDNDSEISTTKEVEECTSEKGSEHGKESPERSSRKRKLSETKTDEEEAKEPNEKANDEPIAEGSNNDSEPEVASAEESQNPDLPENSTLLDTSLTSLPDETANMSSTSANINDSISNDLKTINTGMETYGKGKRARVPNKRYSDISRAVSRTPKHESSRAAPKTPSASSRNGEFPDDDLGEILREESELEAQKEIAKKTLSAKKPSKLDLSSPALRKPFKYGWRRELVIRATATDGKRNGDIYYYSPSGKKLRSMREVGDYIVKTKDLNLENFTFFKEPLGINDHTKEIIRDAKRPGGQITPQSKKISQKMLIKTKKRPRSLTPPAQTPKSKSGKTPSFKVKPPIKGTTPKKEKKDTANLEMATVAPNWTFSKKSKSNRKLGASPSHAVKSPSKVSSSATTRAKETKQPVSRIGPPNFMNMYLQNLQYGYTTLFYVFQYLKVQDLLRAGCVCSMWRDLSRHPALWRTVRMKNSQIHSFEGMANALKKHGTDHLDLRKMLLPSNTNNDDIWPTFTNAIKKVETLRRIELCRCLASVVEDLARNNHNLEVINAVTIKCESMNFEPFANLVNLVDLRIKSTAGLTLSSDLSALKSLTKLKHLSITSIKDLNMLNIEVISELENLEVLDLGECSNFPRHFGSDILSKLTKLEKLRLEKGQGECYTFDILEAVKDLENLQQLELVNFDIKAGFDKALGACFNIKKLLIIPTYISQSATTNHMVLGGVLRLQKTLSHFVWGVTLELLRVTELFVDQCEQPDKKEPKDKSTSADSIPVLKPVPLHGIQQPSSETGASDTPQVEILPLPNLQKLLLQNLPQTRVKILKIPFHATWRQNIIDSVN